MMRRPLVSRVLTGPILALGLLVSTLLPALGADDAGGPGAIDPGLVTSTYLGGEGTDSVAAVAVDGSGSIYLAGSTDSADFRTLNPVQSRLNLDAPAGPSDAFVAKLEPSGDKLVWATFLGGGSNDAALDLVVAADGSVVVTGVTESPDFPRAGEAPAQGEYGGGPSDAFVARISPAGSTLIYSTFLGGAELDSGRAIAVDAGGAAYVTGSTSSGDFPSVNPLRGARRTDDVDAFVTKVNAAGASFVYSTRLGGRSDDHGLDLALTGAGAVVVVGDTRSPDFPVASPLQAGIGGGPAAGDANSPDGFVAQLDPAGSALEHSTFLGGADSDQATGIALDAQGSIFVTGNTSSTDFPTASPQQPSSGGDSDAFLTKLDAAATALTWSTYLGGTGADGGNGVVVDNENRPTVVGVVSSTDFPTVEPVQAGNGGGASDGFVSTYNSGGTGLVASTYLGGDDEDQLAAAALAGADPIAVGSSASTNLTLVRPIQPARATGTSDGFVTRVSLTPPPPPAAAAESEAEPSSSGSGTSGHDRRVQVLVVLTAVLFLAAVAQTAYLRRKDAASVFGGARGGSAESASGVGGVGGAGAGIGGVDGDDERWSSVAVLAPTASGSRAIDDWTVPEPPVPAADDPEESFWDLFPEELPPHGRVPGDDEWWAGDFPTDDLLNRRPSSGPAPLGPPPARQGPATPGAPGMSDRSGTSEPTGPEADVLLTELLAGDLAPVESASPAGGRRGLGGLGGHGDGNDDLDEGDGNLFFGDGGDDDDGGGDGPVDATVPRKSGGTGAGGRRGKPRNRRSGRRKRPSKG